MTPKFRAWDKGTGLMNDITVIDLENEEIYYHHWRYGHSEAIPISDIELLQSTGLKDKNGVDIFYNDIVKVSYKEHSYISYIIYEFHETTIEGEYIPKDFRYYENPLYVIFEDDNNDHTIEVIGNIFKNKDLLKE